MPGRMKEIVVLKPNELMLQETEIPQIKTPTQVLVKIMASGICGSDMGVYKGKSPYAVYPRVLGHEASAVVVETGSDVTDLKSGDSVVIEPITYCGTCYACRKGHHNVCRNLTVLTGKVDGTFREYMVVEQSQLYRYDASKMNYVQASLCEPYTIGLQANWRAETEKGDFVLVHGAGPIGLIVADVAKQRGAVVMISEPNEDRLGIARKFNLDDYINPLQENLDERVKQMTDGEGVNVVFDAAGVPAVISNAVELLSPAGRFVPLTYKQEPIPINFQAVNAKELTILGTRHQYQKFPEVVGSLPENLKHVDLLVTHIFRMEEFQQAFDVLDNPDSKAVKVVMTFGDKE